MPLQSPCPTCNQVLTIPDHLGGKQVQCPACQIQLMAPLNPGEGFLPLANAGAAPQPTAPSSAPSIQVAQTPNLPNPSMPPPPADAMAGESSIHRQAIQSDMEAPPHGDPNLILEPSAEPSRAPETTPTPPGMPNPNQPAPNHAGSQSHQESKPTDPTQLQFCPECGTKWKTGSVTCKKCFYNAVMGVRIKAGLGKKRKFSLIRLLDFQKAFLVLFVGGLLAGAYWLSTNWSTIEGGGHNFMDIRENTKEDRTDIDRRSKRRKEKESSGRSKSRRRRIQTEKEKPEETKRRNVNVEIPDKEEEEEKKKSSAAVSVEEKTIAALKNLENPEKEAGARMQLKKLAEKKEALPLLAKALKESVLAGKNKQFAVKFTLASFLSGKDHESLAEAYVVCLAPKEVNARQTHQLRSIALRTLPRQGLAFDTAVTNALKTADPHLKAAIIHAAYQEKWRKFNKAILNLATDPDPGVRRAALKTMSGRHAAQHIDTLIAAARDEDASVATEASKALFGHAANALPKIRTALENSSPSSLSFPSYLRLLAPTFTQRSTNQNLNSFMAKIARDYAEGDSTVSLPSDESSTALIKSWERDVFHSRQRESRGRLLNRTALQKSWNPPRTAFMASLMLADPDLNVRRRAAWTINILGTNNSRLVFQALCTAICDPSLSVAMPAAEAAAKAPADIPTGSWLKMSDGRDIDRLRALADGILKSRGDKQAESRLRQLMQDKNAELSARTMALYWLAKEINTADQPALENILSALEADKEAVFAQWLYFSALKEMNDPGARQALVSGLSNARSEEERMVILHELHRTKGDDVRRAVLAALRSGILSDESSWSGCRILAQYQSEGMLAELMEILPRATGPAREALAEAVGNYGESALPHLQKLYDASEKKQDVRSIALIAWTRAIESAVALQNQKPTHSSSRVPDITARLGSLKPAVEKMVQSVSGSKSLMNEFRRQLSKLMGVGSSFSMAEWKILFSNKTAPTGGPTDPRPTNFVVCQMPKLWTQRGNTQAEHQNFGHARFTMVCRSAEKEVMNNTKLLDFQKDLEKRPDFKSNGGYTQKVFSSGGEFRLAGTAYRIGNKAYAKFFATLKHENKAFDFEAEFSCAAPFWRYHLPLLKETLKTLKTKK